MAEQVPSIGRIVHYVGGMGGHRAAIITQVDNIGTDRFIDAPEVSLCVFDPAGLYFPACVPFDATGTKPETWHWPEYVPARDKQPATTSGAVDSDTGKNQ